MVASRLKSVLVFAAILWGFLIIYLLIHGKNYEIDGLLKNELDWPEKLREVRPVPINNLTSGPRAADSTHKQINIVIPVNEDSICGLIAAVSSTIMHSRHDIHFYFVATEDIADHLRIWMQVPKLKDVKYSLKTIPKHLEKNSGIAKFTFIDLFPSLSGRVIYFDSDVLIQGDVAELLNFRILANSFGSFSDDCHASSVSKSLRSSTENRYGGRLNLKHPAIKEMQKQLNTEIIPSWCTFNSGVFVSSDVDYWRKENVSHKIMSLVTAHQNQSILGTQGGSDEVEAAMLVVFYKRISPLDPVWHVRHLGVTPGSRYSAKYLSQSKLLHWNGHFKPWGRRATEQQTWDKYFIADPLGKFKPIRREHL